MASLSAFSASWDNQSTTSITSMYGYTCIERGLHGTPKSSRRRRSRSSSSASWSSLRRPPVRAPLSSRWPVRGGGPAVEVKDDASTLPPSSRTRFVCGGPFGPPAAATGSGRSLRRRRWQAPQQQQQQTPRLQWHPAWLLCSSLRRPALCFAPARAPLLLRGPPRQTPRSSAPLLLRSASLRALRGKQPEQPGPLYFKNHIFHFCIKLTRTHCRRSLA